ncbi:MAG: ATP synthase F1 subunit delta [Bacteroidales bacterium]|nr:ATP synthase F1 subunit delta [Bacteroidales bacterium]MBN2764457.1 ATP synthase F1 subunit delta [Bacteroidales bacterium]
MNESKISVRYAKAMLEHAREENKLGQAKDDMIFIGRCIREVPEFILLLETPVVRTAEKKKIIEKAIGDQITPLTLSFVNLVFNQKRESFLESISRHFLYLYNKEMGISPALLITAEKVDPDIRKNIVDVISQKLKTNIDLVEQTDEKIKGGFVMRIEDHQIDASIASRLAKIRKELIY